MNAIRNHMKTLRPLAAIGLLLMATTPLWGFGQYKPVAYIDVHAVSPMVANAGEQLEIRGSGMDKIRRIRLAGREMKIVDRNAHHVRIQLPSDLNVRENPPLQLIAHRETLAPVGFLLRIEGQDQPYRLPQP